MSAHLGLGNCHISFVELNFDVTVLADERNTQFETASYFSSILTRIQKPPKPVKS